MAFPVFSLSLLMLLLSPLLVRCEKDFQPCPLLGPFYPKPIDLPNQKPMKAALEALTSNLTQAIHESNSTGGHGPIYPNTTSFSVALFDANTSSQDAGFFYDFHHTATVYRDTHADEAVTDVDARSVYRIGDLTELFTMWIWLIESGGARWDDPITNFVPELAEGSSGDELHAVKWCDVTVGDLAGHLSGMARDCKDIVSNRNVLNLC